MYAVGQTEKEFTFLILSFDVATPRLAEIATNIVGDLLFFRCLTGPIAHENQKRRGLNLLHNFFGNYAFGASTTS